MRNTGPGISKLSLLKFPGFSIVSPPFNVSGRQPVPCLISLGICVSELLFGAEAIREFVKLQVGLYWGHAANQDNQNPFHRNTHLSAPNGEADQKQFDKGQVPWGACLIWSFSDLGARSCEVRFASMSGRRQRDRCRPKSAKNGSR
jgi:hypothetical protein